MNTLLNSINIELITICLLLLFWIFCLISFIVAFTIVIAKSIKYLIKN